MTEADRYPHAVRGIGLLVLGTTAFGCLDTFSKILVAYYPAPALVWLRFVLQTLVMAVIFVPRMGREDGTWPLVGACGDLSERTRMSRCRKADQMAEHRCT